MTITFHNPDDFEKKSPDAKPVFNLQGVAENIPNNKPDTYMFTGRNKRKKINFIKALENGETVSEAAAALKITRADLYQWRRVDTTFDAAWTQAWELGAYVLEEEAVRRAVEGTEKPVFRGGEVVGHMREYSDSMLMFLLKARKPELFGTSVKSDRKNQANQKSEGDKLDLASEIDEAKRTLDCKLLQAVTQE